MSVGQELAQFGRALIGRNVRVIDPAESAHRQDYLQRFGDPSFQGWVDSFLNFQGQIYQPGYTTTYAGQKVEPVTDSFLGYTSGAYKRNGVIFAVSMARARPFSEIAFKFRRRRQSGGGSDLFPTRALDILDTPWPGGTTQDLLMRAEQDITCGGTAFWARESGRDGDRLRRLRPDWCEFILTAPPDKAVQADVVGIKYTPGGPWSGGTSELYLVGGKYAEAAFWAPIPDPDALYRGMSWLSPIIEEMQADKAASTHKLKFFENAATPNLSVSLKESVSPESFQKFVRQMTEASVGVENAYKTLYTGGGADVRVIGADMQQLDFRATQGAGETRIAAAGGVPPIVVGLSEGLAAATYSNYGQARRAYADIFLRSQWRSLCGALAPIIDVPDDATLWYDAADVAFLREDTKDLAQIQSTQAGTISTLISAGYTPETCVAAVLAEDFSLLKHSGMMSVQLQAPGQPDDGNAEPEPVDDTAETATKAGTIAGLIGTQTFDPESIVTAVEADDLTQLEIVEPMADPGEAPGEEIEPDPEDDAAVAEGIDDLAVARHLPGKHDQGKHGNRFKIRGDRASGLASEGKERAPRKTEPKTPKTEPEKAKPTPPKPDPEPETPAARVDRAESRSREIMSGYPVGDWVGLDRIREKLADDGFTFDEQDEALMRLWADRSTYQFMAEANQKSLTDERRISSLSIGNQDKHYVKRYK